MADDEAALTAEAVHAYAAGRMSWREVREITGVEDFNVMLTRLGDEGLRLPRATRDRPSEAKRWMREILAARAAAA